MQVDRLTLFQRWWDTANPIPKGMSDRATNVFCNSESNVGDAGLSKINGFFYQCRREEGDQAAFDPFDNEACPLAEMRTGIQRLPLSTALILQIRKAAVTAVSTALIARSVSSRA
jgi:hypothetical protein